MGEGVLLSDPGSEEHAGQCDDEKLKSEKGERCAFCLMCPITVLRNCLFLLFLGAFLAVAVCFM